MILMRLKLCATASNCRMAESYSLKDLEYNEITSLERSGYRLLVSAAYETRSAALYNLGKWQLIGMS